jgi:hypothetical protein
MDQKSYNAVLDQMQMEITAAKAAPQSVRKAFNAAVTGRGGHDAPAPGAPHTVTNAADYAKVPSGAEYMAPDGQLRRKP